MYVPPYVPQQLEIPGNVALEKYDVRLGFIRRVALLHACTAVIAAAMAFLPIPPMRPAPAALLVLFMLVVLSLVRGLAKGREADQKLSVFLLPFVLLAISAWFRALYEQEWAIWALGVGVVCAAAYTVLCGRDLSFVGMFVLALLASSVLILAICWQLRIPKGYTASALSLNAIYLFYYVYDLAALLTRRRLGEEWGSVCDLYRDVLNGIAYPIRVWTHWKKHNIWGVPKEWFR